MACANINGIKIHCETYGSGPALLMMAPADLIPLSRNGRLLECGREGDPWRPWPKNIPA